MQSAAPGEAAFVKTGDRIKKGQVVGIIEAMKLMNEIEVRSEACISVSAVAQPTTTPHFTHGRQASACQEPAKTQHKEIWVAVSQFVPSPLHLFASLLEATACSSNNSLTLLAS